LSDTVNPRLTAALAYAAKGWHVFPVLPRLKVPQKGGKGLHDATLDADRIAAWWRVNPDFNVAISTGPSHLLVVDVDPGGEDAWAELLASCDALRDAARRAYQVQSPRGTLHYYFANPEALGSSSGRLAQHIDTRGIGGYVLAPPSYVDDGKSKGRYTLMHDGDFPAVPEALATLLRRPVNDAPLVVLEASEFDSPDAVSRATAFLTGRVAAADLEGSYVHQTFETACVVLEMGISPERAFPLMRDLWNPHRLQPRTDADLRQKIQNAWKYGQETKGGKAEKSVEEQFAHLLSDDTPATPPDLQQAEADLKARYMPKTLGEARKNRKPLEWIIPELLPRKGIGITFGPPGTFKTFLLLDLAMAIATGYGPNWWEGMREPQQVLFLAGESPDALVTKRVDAWLAMNLLPGLTERAEANLIVVEGVPPMEMTDYYRDIIGWLRERGYKPSLTILDTLTRAMAGRDENSAKDATWTTMKMEWLSRELSGFVMAVHHTGKDAGRGARGSSVWEGNTDVMLEVERPSKAEMGVLVHLRKLKEGGATELPLKFEGAIHGDAPAFTRDWLFAPETNLPASVVEQKESEEWLQPAVIRDMLAQGPLTTEHLTASIKARFGHEHLKTIRRKLEQASRGRYRAWMPDGVTWRVPVTEPVAEKGEF